MNDVLVFGKGTIFENYPIHLKVVCANISTN